MGLTTMGLKLGILQQLSSRTTQEKKTIKLTVSILIKKQVLILKSERYVYRFQYSAYQHLSPHFREFASQNTFSSLTKPKVTNGTCN